VIRIVLSIMDKIQRWFDYTNTYNIEYCSILEILLSFTNAVTKS